MSNLFPEENDEISEAEKFPQIFRPENLWKMTENRPERAQIYPINGVLRAEI